MSLSPGIITFNPENVGLLGDSNGKESACSAEETRVPFLGLEGRPPPRKDMATHSSIPAWRIRWTEEPGGLQSRGLQSQTGLSG